MFRFFRRFLYLFDGIAPFEVHFFGKRTDKKFDPPKQLVYKGYSYAHRESRKEFEGYDCRISGPGG